MDEHTLTGDVVIVPPAGWHARAPAQWREGRQVVPYTSMVEARRHPDTALVIKAEDGEQQVLLTCPLRLVAAGEAELLRLTRDLCRLFVWEVFVANDHDVTFGTYSLYFVPLTRGDVVKGRGIGGPMTDGLWLDPELERNMLLRPHVEEVLSGRLARMALPDGFPMDSAGSLEEIRPYPLSCVTMFSGVYGDRVLDAATSIIQVPESALHLLLSDIDSMIRAHPRYRPLPNSGPSHIWFQRYIPRMDCPAEDLVLLPDREADRYRDAVLQVLAGTRARLIS